MEHKKNCRSLRKAQSLVEFALVMPMLMLLIFAIIEFGWITFNYSQLYNGMREGLRYASVPGTDASNPQITNCIEIKRAIIKQTSLTGLTLAGITISYDTGDPNTAIGTCNTTNVNLNDLSLSRNIQNGDRVKINISFNIRFLTPFAGAFLPNGIAFNITAARSIFPGGLDV